jgi:hypothetical protein
MQFARILTVIGAIMGGFLMFPGTPASAAPVTSGVLATTAISEPLAAYAQYRRYRHRYYAPRRVYRPSRSYGRPYYRPRVVCRVRYTPWGARRRVCTRRW